MSKLTQAKQLIGMFFLFLLLLATSTEAAVNEQIEMYLETPAPDQTITGVLFTRGWAVAPAGIARVELYIDGTFILEIPLGESRPEVGAMFPSFPGSDTSGFNIGLFYSRFANGPHTATVRAIDTNGDYKEVTNSFAITRFDTSAVNNFLRDPSKVDLTGATVSLDGNSILIHGMVVDGVDYTVRVEWNTTLQGLAISQIEAPINPSITFTNVPPLNSFENLQGQVLHVDPSLHSVVVYIRVSGRWWVKPFANKPLTPIAFNGNFVTDITTGGRDQTATEIIAFLVRNDYQAPIALGWVSLPAELWENALAHIQVTR